MTIRDTQSEAGSLEWFTEKQRLIGEDAWALDSALFAFRSLRKIDQLWDGEDSEIRAGLFVAAVVSYCRPSRLPEAPASIPSNNSNREPTSAPICTSIS